MQKTKVAITLDAKLLGRLDALVDKGRFSNRSQAIEAAITDKLDRVAHRRLARECSKLDRTEEQSLADEGPDFNA
jgi:metal-responsive CopG/Arc/MetJ family transcriptional regulator